MAVKKRVPGKDKKSLYRPEYAAQARKLCLLGAKDKQIADFFEVGVTTISDWKDDFPEFKEAIRQGEIIADANVADRMYSRAVGYSYKDTDIRTCNGKIVQTKVVRHLPPDPKAGEYWLTCRQKKNWKVTKEVSGPGGGPIEVTDPSEKPSDIEIARRIAFYLQNATEGKDDAGNSEGPED